MNSFIKTAFRWYYSKDKTLGYEAVAKQFQHHALYPGSHFSLIAPNNTLLPFQFFISVDTGVFTDLVATQWLLINVNTGATIDFTSKISGELSVFQVAGKGLWWTYIPNLYESHIPCGQWYSAIKLGQRWVVSEQFRVVNDDFLNKCVKLEWSHNCDAAGILYNGNSFQNRLYLEAEPDSLAPIIYEEGVENADKDFIPSKTIYVDQYQIVDLVPEYLVEAFNAIRLHKSIFVTLRPLSAGAEAFEVKVRDVQEVWDTQSLALLTMKMQTVKKLVSVGCCDNETQSALFPALAYPDLYLLKAGIASHTITLSVLNNDEGYNLSVIGAGIMTAAGGTAVTNPDGTFSYDPPTTGYIGPDNFTYEIEDGFGQTDTGLVSLVIDNVHAEDDYYNVSDVPITNIAANQGVLINDHIPWNHGISPVIYVLGGGASQTINSVEGDGNFIILDNVTGAFSYHQVNPAAAVGGTNNFKYKIFTGIGIIGPNTNIEITVS